MVHASHLLPLALASAALARPTRMTLRDNQSATIVDQMSTIIKSFMATSNADTDKGFTWNAGQSTIDFSGSTANFTIQQANLFLFRAVDQVVNGTNSFSHATCSFAQSVNDIVEKGIQLNNTAQKALNQTRDSKNAKCNNARNARNAVLTLFKQDHPDEDSSSDDFANYAADNATYAEAKTDCINAGRNYSATIDEVYGPDYATFVALSANCDPLTDVAQTGRAVAGITMAVATSVDTDQAVGKTVAEYDIPELNYTLTQWQQGNGLSPVSQSADSTNSTESSDSTEIGAGGSVGIRWFDLGGSFDSKTQNSFSNVSSSSISISFGSIQLMDVAPGLWFDNFAAAAALANPTNDKAKNNDLQKAFKTSFGSKDKPGPAAVYNYQVLVGYQPSVSLEFTNQQERDHFDSLSVSSDACVLGFICANHHFDQEHHKVDKSSSDNTWSYSDTTTNAHIIGFTVRNAWDQFGNAPADGISL